MSVSRRPPRYDLPNAAPGPLRLVQLFLNTSDHETGRELFPTADAVQEWWAELGHDIGPVTATELRRVRQLRSDLREIVAGEKGAAILDEAARRAKLSIAFEGPQLVSGATGVDRVLGALVAAVYEAMRDGDWPRLKTCRNCGWAFWDRSKNRSAAWCSMQLCGGRLKVRRYRDRQVKRGASRSP